MKYKGQRKIKRYTKTVLYITYLSITHKTNERYQYLLSIVIVAKITA
jgi:hypothetical protein